MAHFKTITNGMYLPQGKITPNFDLAYLTAAMQQYADEKMTEDDDFRQKLPGVVKEIRETVGKKDEVKLSGRSASPLQGTENEVKLSSRGYEKPPIGINNDFVFDHFTQEHKSAVKWANREDVHVRDRALVFYRNRWYVIEKYDDMDYGYLVVKHIKKADLQKYHELRRMQDDGRNETGLAEPYRLINSKNRETTQSGRKGHGSDDVIAEHAPEDQEIFGLGQNENGERQNQGDTGTGAIGSDADRAWLGTAGLKFSSRDASYLKAVEDGDMETAQQMVDEAAKAAFPDSAIRDKDGNLLKVRHGTDADFWSFDITKHGGKHGTAEGYGIYLTDKPEVSESYGDRQIVGYANIVRPARDNRKTIKRSELSRLVESTVRHEAERMVEEDGYDSVEEAMFDTWISNYVYTYEYSGIRAAIEAVADVLLKMDDNDADIVQEVMNGMGIRDSAGASAFYDNDLTPTTGIDGIWRVWNRGEGSREANIILAFRSEQIKSADPVTYDDDGNVIPLSERFNQEKKDIRFSGRGGTSDSPLQGTENEVKLSTRGYEKPPIGINNDFVFDHFTQEHKSAVKWANREDVHVRDRALVFYRNRWYVIEKYDDMDYGYLVRFAVKTSELKNFEELRRLNNDGRNAKTLAGQHSRIDSDHRREIGNERPGNESDDDALEYATEDQEIFGLDENKRRGRDDNSNNSAGAVGSDADRAGLGTAGLRFSARDNDGSDARTLLSNALLETAQTDAERDLLERYQAKIGDRNKDDVRLGKIRDQIREMMFAKGPRDAAYKEKLAKLNAQAKKSNNRLAAYDKELLKLEATKPLQSVLEAERLDRKYGASNGRAAVLFMLRIRPEEGPSFPPPEAYRSAPRGCFGSVS